MCAYGQVGHFLPAVAQPEALDPAAAPGDQGLHLLQAGGQFVILGVEEGQEAAVPFRDVGREVKNGADPA